MSAHILVLDGHSRAALECVQSFGRAGHTVEVAAAHDDARALRSRYVAARHRQPVEPEAFDTWLSLCDEIGHFDLIVPCTEASLRQLLGSALRDRVWERTVLPDPEALVLALDKHLTWEHARRVGVPVPQSLYHARGAVPTQAAGLPCVVKTATSKIETPSGSVSVPAEVVNDEAQRQAYLARWLPYSSVQEQHWVAGDGIGIEVLYERGRLRWIFAHRRLHEWPLSGGASTYREAIAVPAELESATLRLLDPLGWHGVAMVEFKYSTPESFHLIEINPRLWGSLALAIDAGANFPLGLLALAKGGDPGPTPLVRRGWRTRCLPEDLEWVRENLRARRDDPLLKVCPRGRSLLQWGRLLLGLESVDHFDLRDPGPLRALLTSYGAEKGRGLSSRVGDWFWRLGARRHAAHLPAGVLRNVHVLCYGNICRSPLVEVLGRQLAPQLNWSSSGFHLTEGRSMPEDFQRVVSSSGVDLGAHRSRRAQADVLGSADLILVMDRANLRRVREEFRGLRRRTVLLGPFGPDRALEIADPYGTSAQAQTRIASQIHAAVQGLVAALQSGGHLPR